MAQLVVTYFLRTRHCTGGVALGKADVVKQWRPEMRAIGFLYRDNMFQLAATTEENLQFCVSIQKNSYATSYKISPSILLRSPFVETTKQQVLLMANLRRDGIYLHERTESWWPPESLPDALDLLKRLALPWFREWGNATFLAAQVEIAIRERKHLINVFEPLTQEEQAAIARVWYTPADPNWRVPAVIFRYSSILHYLAGNRPMAITRTKDWLERLDPHDKTERHQAQAQLTALERIH
jgi:hypothetical protein